MKLTDDKINLILAYSAFSLIFVIAAQEFNDADGDMVLCIYGVFT